MAFNEIKLRVQIGSLNPMPEGWRFRTSLRGRLILQRLHEVVEVTPYGKKPTYPGWRDATVSDLQILLTVEETKP